ncbi:MAG: hypothetical protein GXY03_13020, partial [Solirubrobacterales bacterium]|nr:hypothetical protein [Solirubrobacterales bacterium]
MGVPILEPLLDRLVAHPWLIGDPRTPGAVLGRRVRWTTTAAIVLANLGGAAVVISFALLVLPKPDGVVGPDVTWSNLGLA